MPPPLSLPGGMDDGGDEQQLQAPQQPQQPGGVKGYLLGVLNKLPKGLAMVESAYGNPAPLHDIEMQEQQAKQARQQQFQNTVTAQRENRANQMYKAQLSNFQSELQYRQFQMAEGQRKALESQTEQQARLIAAHISDPAAPPIPGVPKMSPDQARAYLDALKDKISPQHYITGADGNLMAVDERTNVASPVVRQAPNPAAAARQEFVNQNPPLVDLAAGKGFTPPAPTLNLPVQVKDPMQALFGKPNAGVGAVVGPMPQPKDLPNDLAYRAALHDWGVKYQQTDREQKEAIASAYAANRPIPGGVYDPEQGASYVGTIGRGIANYPGTNTPMMTGSQAGAFGASVRRATFREVDQNLANVEKFLPAAAGSPWDAGAAAMLLNPASGTLGQIAQGQLLKRVSPDQQNLINAIRNLRQGITSLRNVLSSAGGASDKRIDILESEIPNVAALASGDPAVLQRQLDTFKSIYTEILNSYPEAIMSYERNKPGMTPQAPNRPPKGAKQVELKDFLNE